MANLKVDFFRVTPVGQPGEVLDLDPMLKILAGCEDDDPTRCVGYGREVFIRLYRLKKSGSKWYGDLIRIRMDRVPVRAPLRGDVVPFELGPNEGVGEQTAFIYDPRLKVLALQRHRVGVTASAVAHFIDETGSGLVNLVPVLRANGLQRLASLNRVKAIDVHFAGVEDPARVTSRNNPGAKAMGVLLRQFGAPNAAIRLSIGRSGVFSLIVGEVRSALTDLLGLSGGTYSEVTKLEVSGITEDDENDIFDLTKMKLVVSVPVGATSPSRVLEYADRRTALQSAWDSVSDELTMMFSPR